MEADKEHQLAEEDYQTKLKAFVEATPEANPTDDVELNKAVDHKKELFRALEITEQTRNQNLTNIESQNKIEARTKGTAILEDCLSKFGDAENSARLAKLQELQDNAV